MVAEADEVAFVKDEYREEIEGDMEEIFQHEV